MLSFSSQRFGFSLLIWQGYIQPEVLREQVRQTEWPFYFSKITRFFRRLESVKQTNDRPINNQQEWQICCIKAIWARVKIAVQFSHFEAFCKIDKKTLYALWQVDLCTIEGEGGGVSLRKMAIKIHGNPSRTKNNGNASQKVGITVQPNWIHKLRRGQTGFKNKFGSFYSFRCNSEVLLN